MEITLLNKRARALIQMRARQDADGCHQYQGVTMIDAMLELMRAELEEEYEAELQRHVRLREVVGG